MIAHKPTWLNVDISLPPHTTSLWGHNKSNLMCTLVINNFGVWYTNKNNAKYLLAALQDLYPITVNWSGTKYLSLTLEWNCILGYVDISMPGYITAVLIKFLHILNWPQESPHE